MAVTISVPRPPFRFPTPIILAAGLCGVFAGFAPPLIGAAALLGGVVVVLAIASPVLGLSILALAVPFSPSGIVDRLPITPTDLLAAVLLATVIGSRLAGRRLALTLTRAFWPGIAFIVVLTLSAAFAPLVAESAKELLRWIEVVGILVVAATYCQNRSDRRLVTFALFLGLTVEGLLGWFQFLLRRGPDGFRIGSFLRAYGTFGQPNPFAGYLVMTLPIAVATILWVRSGSTGESGFPARTAIFLSQAAAIAAFVGVVALLMSLSRGALLGFGAAALVLIALYTRRGGAIVGVLVLAVLVVVFLASTGLVPAFIGDRLTQVWGYVGWFDAARVTPSPQNWAIVERMAHWQAGWNMYFANPILGVGPGHFAIAYPDYRVNDFWKDPLGHAHNIYLNVMAEEGALGIITYVIQLVSWGAVAVAAFRRSRDAADRALAAGVLASLVGVAVHNLFDNLSVHGLGIETGLLIGMSAAIGLLPDEKPLVAE